ncbi:Iron only hydrogenase large subunit, C-terminal domain [Natronincola peptidivorans]|uniref:Iron only hydrogenase large subunit, C-terminal domain n=1 Tax=Natronincola peptidivorans TaxID=426128 RepID=A0A1I0C7G6_9FIRM|nr:[Fe-Fe] hydrogenase large subunit C-terminal domain-containing protein [Natronincola peptidivorans]SET15400.1 Iron only hydrogenase large subunit, C-terminal domain [Natronincola peptidivorans]
MSFFDFSRANCKNCYKCLHYCAVKAIKMRDEQAEIVKERCIACGQCFFVCPQDAREVKCDLDDIKAAIKAGKKVIASLAPSFPGAFEIGDNSKMISALKKLGFEIIEETAVGAMVIADLYKTYIEESQHKNIITTSCPSANFLIEQYYPMLTQYMIPLVSPMIAHGKILKRIYGMDSYVVFIGPCISKKIESMDSQHQGVIDGVLTFDELQKWMDSEAIDPNLLEEQPWERISHARGRGFPLGGGILKSVLKNDTLNYESIAVDGIHECIDLLNSLKEGSIEGALVEISVCKGSCIGGPAMPKATRNYFKSKKRVRDYVSSEVVGHSNNDMPIDNISFSKHFSHKAIEKSQASEEEIAAIMKKMGKYNQEDQLNCGSCGYNTCIEKAQAVHEGMAETDMCLPFMRNKAENVANVILDNSPNAILLLDEDMRVKEFNATAERIFRISSIDIKNKAISTILNDSSFYNVKSTKRSIIGKKISYPQYGIVLIHNIIYIENENLILVIMNDMTEEEKHKKELTRVKESTINSAQRVIEKQMRVSQEIASLLGETTAETKVILSRLKKIALEEAGNE